MCERESKADKLLTLQHLVVHPLLTSNDQVKLLFAALEALRPRLNALIPLQHVQDPVLRVSEQQQRQGKTLTFKKPNRQGKENYTSDLQGKKRRKRKKILLH